MTCLNNVTIVVRLHVKCTACTIHIKDVKANRESDSQTNDIEEDVEEDTDTSIVGEL